MGSKLPFACTNLSWKTHYILFLLKSLNWVICINVDLDSNIVECLLARLFGEHTIWGYLNSWMYFPITCAFCDYMGCSSHCFDMKSLEVVCTASMVVILKGRTVEIRQNTQRNELSMWTWGIDIFSSHLLCSCLSICRVILRVKAWVAC